MPDYLQRDQAPLSSEVWEEIDHTVTNVARRQLLGRRVLDMVGPLGPGVPLVPHVTLAGVTPATLGGDGAGNTPITVSGRAPLPLALIAKDFTIYWQDLQATAQFGTPLDLGAAGAAAALCAVREDELIFYGDKTLGVDGLLTSAGRQAITRRDWGMGGNAFLDVVDGIERLAGAGFQPPYALMASPGLFACLLRVYGNSGILELNQARELCAGGVYQTSLIKNAVLLAQGPQNMDLIVGQDLQTAYVAGENLNHIFRVFETVALRIKQPGAICVLEARSAHVQRVRRGVPEEATGVG